jgi:hypothetical protein
MSLVVSDEVTIASVEQYISRIDYNVQLCLGDGAVHVRDEQRLVSPAATQWHINHISILTAEHSE